MNPELTTEERTLCEIWTRVVGYHRPVSEFNIGKQQEHWDRVQYRLGNDIKTVCQRNTHTPSAT